MRLSPVTLFLLILTASFRGENCDSFSAAPCYNFDTVTAGVIVEGEIPFTNTGQEPMLIWNITTSTGAMVAWATKEPIAPGKGDIIRFKFMTMGKSGPQSKSITVQYGSDCYAVVKVNGVVQAAVADKR